MNAPSVIPPSMAALMDIFCNLGAGTARGQRPSARLQLYRA